jgi:hypothetical protein
MVRTQGFTYTLICYALNNDLQKMLEATLKGRLKVIKYLVEQKYQFADKRIFKSLLVCWERSSRSLENFIRTGS